MKVINVGVASPLRWEPGGTAGFRCLSQPNNLTSMGWSMMKRFISEDHVPRRHCNTPIRIGARLQADHSVGTLETALDIIEGVCKALSGVPRIRTGGLPSSTSQM